MIGDVKIKIVPMTDPNADGEWIDTPAMFSQLPISFRDAADKLAAHVPEGHFVVSITKIADHET